MKTLYTANLQLGIGDEDTQKTALHDSKYLEKYKQNLVSSAQKDDWKYQGAGAQFQGVQSAHAYEIEASTYSINSVCPFDESHYIYSATAKGASTWVSAIIKKDYQSGEEQFLINRNKESLSQIDYDGGDKIAVSVQNIDDTAKNIAVLNVRTNDFFALSGGDSVDEHPYFSKRHHNRIFFDSRGIGRDNSMRVVELASSTICAITDNSKFEEVLIEPNFDVFCPKDDEEGNLYYMKKPHKKARGRGVLRMMLDALLLPFWLVYGLFRLLVFFAGVAKRSSEKNKNKSYGNNPTKAQDASDREIYIQNQLINLDKEEKKNAKKGDKDTAGFAPKNVELWCMDKEGNKTKIAKGVLSYDITKDNKIVYNNGKFCFIIDDNEEGKKVIFKDKFINQIRVVKSLDKPVLPSVF